MGRLIDADALKQDFRKYQIKSLIAHTEEKNVFDVINEQPTAYDVEKVVAELEEEKFDMDNCRYDVDLNTTIDMAISVVKRGGV